MQSKNQTRTTKAGPKRKIQKQCIETGEVLEVFESAQAAKRSIGPKASQGNITMVCQGKRTCAYGFKWSYAPIRECPGETWKVIAKHPTYKISNYGRVMNKHGVINDYIDKSRKDTYPRIMIRKTKYGLHVLMGDAFIGKTDPKQVYNHKDGNMWNCTLENIGVCSQSENILHSYELGLRTSVPHIHAICLRTGQKRKYRSIAHASTKLNVSIYRIRRMVKSGETEHLHDGLNIKIIKHNT
jgi:hypothetical protein